MELELTIPWSQFNFPKIAAHVIDRAMDIAFVLFRQDTEFYDDETRPAYDALMTSISSHMAASGIDFDGKYTGDTPRHPKHLRDSWEAWNIVQGDIVLDNSAPAAYYLYNGNSPGGTGGYITPTQGSYMTFFWRPGRGGPGWTRVKAVRSVEESGRMEEFRRFVQNTIQTSVYRAIEELELPDPNESVLIDSLIPPNVYEAISTEIQTLTTTAKQRERYWKTSLATRSHIKPSRDDWDVWSDIAGKRYTELDKARRAKKKEQDALRRARRTAKEALQETVAKKRVKQTTKTKREQHAAARQTVKKQETVHDRVTKQVEERREAPKRDSGKRFNDIRNLYKDRVRKK